MFFWMILFNEPNYPLQEFVQDYVAVHLKFDRESGVDCPNAILVLLLHIQELWMDILPPILILTPFPSYYDNTATTLQL